MRSVPTVSSSLWFVELVRCSSRGRPVEAVGWLACVSYFENEKQNGLWWILALFAEGTKVCFTALFMMFWRHCIHASRSPVQSARHLCWNHTQSQAYWEIDITTLTHTKTGSYWLTGETCRRVLKFTAAFVFISPLTAWVSLKSVWTPRSGDLFISMSCGTVNCFCSPWVQDG